MSQLLKKDKRPPVRIEIKKNDQVKVIAGGSRGKTGRVLSVHPETGRILVEHINMIKRHTKKDTKRGPARGGGIIEKEAPIAVSNVMVLCGKCGAVRIKHHTVQLAGGRTKRQRVCHKCGLSLDKK
jgi:large subunit ribosomal protein L24